MNSLPKTRTEQILSVMPILAWVAFVGYAIEAGGILVSYGVSWANPDASSNLHRGLDLSILRDFSFMHYTYSVSFLVGLALMKAWTSYLVIRLLSKFTLQNPFSKEVAQRLENISVYSFGTWVVTMLYNAHMGWLIKRYEGYEGNWLSGEFIFIVGVMFILAQVFKRGVEIQSENELTV